MVTWHTVRNETRLMRYAHARNIKFTWGLVTQVSETYKGRIEARLILVPDMCLVHTEVAAQIACTWGVPLGALDMPTWVAAADANGMAITVGSPATAGTPKNAMRWAIKRNVPYRDYECVTRRMFECGTMRAGLALCTDSIFTEIDDSFERYVSPECLPIQMYGHAVCTRCAYMNTNQCKGSNIIFRAGLINALMERVPVAY